MKDDGSALESGLEEAAVGALKSKDILDHERSGTLCSGAWIYLVCRGRPGGRKEAMWSDWYSQFSFFVVVTFCKSPQTLNQQILKLCQ